MGDERRAEETTSAGRIAAALALIEAEARQLRFRDERDEEAARRYIRQGIGAIRYHLRRARPGDDPAADVVLH